MFKKLKKIMVNIKKFNLKISNYISYKNISQAKYLIRLDDSCNTQKRENWEKIELILDQLNIKPIVAVIPFNKDKSLLINTQDKFFWEKVKSWQKKGWEIAVHGHSHIYHNVNKNKLVLPFYNRSEFGGLSFELQSKLIKESYEHFLKNKIKPYIWISPSHTFDKNTLLALKQSTKIRYISDGISLEPFKLMDIIFIPQQLWKPQKRLKGIWTICLHPNSMDNKSIEEFRKIICNPFYEGKFINVKKAETYIKKFSILSYVYSNYFWMLRLLKQNIKKLIFKRIKSN